MFHRGIRLALLVSVLVLPSIVFANPLPCGKAVVEVTGSGESKAWGWEVVKIKVKSGEVSVEKEYKWVHFLYGCVENSKGKSLVMYQAYCGGSACRDLDNWGIIDPDGVKVLLEVSDHNRPDAEKLFGGELPKLSTSL